MLMISQNVSIQIYSQALSSYKDQIKIITICDIGMNSLKSLQLPKISSLTKIEFVNPEPNYTCICCNSYFVKPYQLQCGHRICDVCFTNLSLSSNYHFRCPSDDNDCIESQISEIRPDYSVSKELSQKLIYCPNRNVGCEEKPLLKNLKNHFDEDCQFRIVECPYDCGLSVIKKNELDDHKRICPKKPHSCKFHVMGCSFKGSETELARHMIEYQAKHLEDIVLKLSELEVENLEMKRGYEDTSRKCSIIEHSMKQLEEGISYKMEEAKLAISQVYNSNASANDLNQKLQFVNENDSLRLDVKREVEKQTQHLEKHQKELKELELRLQCIDTTNYNGILVWKINNFNRRLQEAVEGKTLSLYSQPFYTDRYGYKMCARVYLNGDGIGKGQFISLFFVIMKGGYDDILIWPFRHKVTLMLLDQKSLTNNICDSFLPDPKSTSFKRPNSHMNIASGSPKFVCHTELRKNDIYLKNDVIYFKIVVLET